MLAEKRVVPRLEDGSDDDLVVVEWGQVGGLILRPGDRLICGHEAESGLLVLSARGYGEPMLGTRAGGRLYAEPSGVPVSPSRWCVTGSVVAVERSLERGVLSGHQRWCVAAKVRAVRSGVPLGGIAEEVLGEFEGMWMSAREVDALCLRAAMAGERRGIEVAIAAAGSMEAARSLVLETPYLCVRYEVPYVAEGMREAVGAEPPNPPRGIVLRLPVNRDAAGSGQTMLF